MAPARTMTRDEAMQFGRAEGVITNVFDQPRGVYLIVYLETSRQVEVVRDTRVNGAWSTETRDALVWLADQLTQETISNELALRGWEAVGTSSRSSPRESDDPLPRSPAYVLRRTG